MKRRTAFVANSSSSSFLIFGVPREQFREKFPNNDPDDDQFELDSIDDYVGFTLFRTEYGGEQDNDTFVRQVSTCKDDLDKLGLTGGKFYYGVDY